MESNGNGNGSSNRHLLEKLSRYSIGEEIPGEDIPPPTPDNECSCAYSAMLLADNWTAALHLLGTNPTQGITEYPKFARQIGYFANQVDQKCGITHDNISGDPLPQGLIYNVHSMGDNPEDFLKRSIDRNTPAGQNALELSEEESKEVLRKTAGDLILALSMMLSDTETMVLRCSRVKPGMEE